MKKLVIYFSFVENPRPTLFPSLSSPHKAAETEAQADPSQLWNWTALLVFPKQGVGGTVAQRGANTKWNNKGKDGDVTLEQRMRAMVTPELSGESVTADTQEANTGESAASPSLHQMGKKDGGHRLPFLTAPFRIPLKVRTPDLVPPKISSQDEEGPRKDWAEHQA